MPTLGVEPRPYAGISAPCLLLTSAACGPDGPDMGGVAATRLPRGMDRFPSGPLTCQRAFWSAGPLQQGQAMIRRLFLATTMLAAMTLLGTPAASAGAGATAQCSTVSGVKVSAAESPATISVATATGETVEVVVSITGSSFEITEPAGASYALSSASWCVKSSTKITEGSTRHRPHRIQPVPEQQGCSPRHWLRHRVRRHCHSGCSLLRGHGSA